ncbi:MAG: sodium:proton exchanger [Solirubrobacterales bacterium]
MTGRERAFLGAAAAITAVAGVLRYSNAGAVVAFAAATLALAGLAWVVALATEQVGLRFGPAVTGFLQSTLGNLPEFFVVLFALGSGELVVAQTSLIGSIFANALLVLGLVIVAGTIHADDGCFRFRHRLPQDTATLLLVSLFVIVIVGLSVASSDKASHHVEGISTVGAICLLVVYVAWLWRYLRSDPARDEAGVEESTPRISMSFAIALLAAAGTGAAFVSDWFIHALDPAVASLGISKAFAGLVIVAIAGNAVENFTGILLAAKGKSDLAISVVKNSVAQIAAFLFPALVLASYLFTTHLTFSLAPVYIGALFLTAIAVWQITGDGEAQLFEGLALIAIYVVLAAFTLYD